VSFFSRSNPPICLEAHLTDLQKARACFLQTTKDSKFETDPYTVKAEFKKHNAAQLIIKSIFMLMFCNRILTYSPLRLFGWLVGWLVGWFFVCFQLPILSFIQLSNHYVFYFLSFYLFICFSLIFIINCIVYYLLFVFR